MGSVAGKEQCPAVSQERPGDVSLSSALPAALTESCFCCLRDETWTSQRTRCLTAGPQCARGNLPARSERREKQQGHAGGSVLQPCVVTTRQCRRRPFPQTAPLKKAVLQTQPCQSTSGPSEKPAFHSLNITHPYLNSSEEPWQVMPKVQ